MKSADVVIIGGGIIGCSIAYQLGKRGIHALVLEQGEIGMQASNAAVGLLAPFKLLAKPGNEQLELRRASLALFPTLVQELEELTGIDVEYQQTGSLRVADTRQVDRITQWVQGWREQGVEMEVVQEDISRFEPALSPEMQCAVSIPCESQVRATLYMQAVARAAELTGTTLLSHTAAIKMQCDEDGVHAVLTSLGERIECNSLVIAAGAWSNMVANLLCFGVDVAPISGQAIEVAQPASPVQHILFGEGIYIAPKSATHLYIGATHEDTGFTSVVSEHATAKLIDAACRLVPTLADTPVRAWTGLRPSTQNHRPTIGHASTFPNVLVATGHGGFGILLSAITSKLVADMIAHETEDNTKHRLIGPLGL